MRLGFRTGKTLRKNNLSSKVLSGYRGVWSNTLDCANENIKAGVERINNLDDEDSVENYKVKGKKNKLAQKKII